MSVITESLVGFPIYSISNFVGCEDNLQFSWDYAREFKIGEVVYFIDEFKDEKIKQ